MLAANRISLGAFHVLVGPNATGKTTFLDALQFVADVLEAGAPMAVERRTPNFFDLCFDPSKPVAIALEVEVAPQEATNGDEHEPHRLRYELEIGIDDSHGLRVLGENLYIVTDRNSDSAHQPSLFGFDWSAEVIHDKAPRGWRKIVGKTREGKDYFRDERTEWNNVFRFGVGRAALGSLPEDPDRFPLSIAVRDLLRSGIRTLALDARRMREPAGPGGTSKLALDGSNLPYVARALKQRDDILFEQWVAHLRTAIQGLTDVDVRERPEDKHLVLEATFEGRHDQPVPSWLMSDGTLRLMALTLITYAAQPEAEIYLVEEPENGLHPLAVQAAFDSLADPLEGMQILCATHSPVFLAHVRLEDVLVFRRSEDGFAVVRHGPEVPELRDWTGRTNLSELLATGVLS